MEINIKKLGANSIIPTYGSEYAAGCDLYAAINEKIEVKIESIIRKSV